MIYGLDTARAYSVFISNPAPDGNLTINLKVAHGNPVIQLQEASFFIPAGSDEGVFEIGAADVTKTTHAKIDATTAVGVTASRRVTIQPRVTAITNVPATIKGGTSFRATVNLAGKADTPTTVVLQSSQGVLTVPITVVVPAGATSADFTVTTEAVTTPTDVTITADLGEGEATGEVTLTP